MKLIYHSIEYITKSIFPFSKPKKKQYLEARRRLESSLLYVYRDIVQADHWLLYFNHDLRYYACRSLVIVL